MIHLVMEAGGTRSACGKNLGKGANREVYTAADALLRGGLPVCRDCYVAARPA